MDWQQIAALSIVAATALIFLVGKVYRRRVGKGKGSSCLCPGMGTTSSSQSVVFHARKGQRSEIIIKSNAPLRPL